ncbi:MAG: hypothetical protein WC477_01295 [Patescibacteria group bacterium]
MESKPNKAQDPSPWKAVGIVSDILITILVLTTVFAFGGRLADQYLHTGYIFTVIGFVLLIIVGYKVILRKAEVAKKKLGLDRS